MTFEQYWYDILEETAKQKLLELRKAFFTIRRLVQTKQLDKAVEYYKELTKNAYESVREYLNSGDIEVQEFVKILPLIKQRMAQLDEKPQTIGKQDANEEWLVVLRTIVGRYNTGRIKSVIAILDDLANSEDPTIYDEFVKFCLNYKMHIGRKFKNEIYPKVIELRPDLAVLRPNKID